MSFNVKITYKNVPTFTKEEFKSIINDVCDSWAWNVVNMIKLDLTGKKLNVKTGRLRNSITRELKQSSNKTTIKIGSWNVVYAKIHDDKNVTVIRPKQKQWLTIPIGDTKGRARQYSNAHFYRTKRDLFLVQSSKRNSLKVLFLLRKEVKIKGTGYITDNVNNMKPKLELELLIATERDMKAKIK